MNCCQQALDNPPFRTARLHDGTVGDSDRSEETSSPSSSTRCLEEQPPKSLIGASSLRLCEREQRSNSKAAAQVSREMSCRAEAASRQGPSPLAAVTLRTDPFPLDRTSQACRSVEPWRTLSPSMRSAMMPRIIPIAPDVVSIPVMSAP